MVCDGGMGCVGICTVFRGRLGAYLVWWDFVDMFKYFYMCWVHVGVFKDMLGYLFGLGYDWVCWGMLGYIWVCWGILAVEVCRG